ncbi:hypothetical protein MZUP3_240 [Erwinia phage vB_EhrS_49]|uniref:Uncharacterized protein n=1 Tax=Erwinia phage vB_EhrS_49 TaxID=2283026 RepID=A0A4Y1NQZ7_9CAUD|nr:membrane associated protein [Erwinia phage vB_EhrS_49]AXH43448.1 hypothetical protein MZUP3_240 [Erwinia phage vB_EhrS_49]
MATWGAMLTDSAGVPFYIDGTMPLCLISNQTYSLNIGGGTVASQPIHANDGAVRFVFVNSPDPNVYFWYAYDSISNVWSIYASGPGTFKINVYIFGYQYQTPPRWGVAIWDAQGRCVITNETKVLRGLNTIGTEGADSAGYNINTTLTGNIAVAPTMLGSVTGIIQSGGTRPFESRYYTSAYYNGSSTYIRAMMTDTVTGGVQNITYTNFKNRIITADMSKY